MPTKKNFMIGFVIGATSPYIYDALVFTFGKSTTINILVNFGMGVSLGLVVMFGVPLFKALMDHLSDSDM